MKYTEFEAKVKEVNSTWWVDNVDGFIIVTNSDGNSIVCVSKSIKHGLDTNYHERSSIKESDADKLAQLAYELAATPLEEREEPKKYYYRLPYIARGTSYLNFDTGEGLYYSTKKQMLGIQTQFTREEYAKIAKEHDIPDGYHIEEEV
ncbi:hypothetical protein [Brochothrix thermosphacta]|uniref:hypothetical protein n=1 Tax=Brochothrix thermosphacta TaxID=2756 RepID=UPI00265CD498|nr:hypothetical protein [Brochothrix thermosphacta]WKK68316.1 hypothetical protein Q0G00_08310 [Brochothrix thermosphacta]